MWARGNVLALVEGDPVKSQVSQAITVLPSFRTIKFLDFAANFSLIQAELGSGFSSSGLTGTLPLFGDGRLWLYSAKGASTAVLAIPVLGVTQTAAFSDSLAGYGCLFCSDYCAVGSIADGRFRRGRY